MTETVSIGYTLTVAAGGEGTVDIYEVPAAAVLTINHVRIHFPSGNEGNLQVNLRVGIVNIYPTEGSAAGDNTTWEFRTEKIVRSGSKISVYYKNNDSTNPHTCFILIEGILER